MTAGWLVIAVAAATTPDREVLIGVDPGGVCHATFDDVPVPLGEDAAARLRLIKGRTRKVAMRSDPAKGGNVPDRCIGAAIYVLQAAGYELRSAFVGVPHLSRPPRR